jgi:hypothetical protein
LPLGLNSTRPVITNIKVKHLCEQVACKVIVIKYCPTDEMLADMLTKGLTSVKLTSLLPKVKEEEEPQKQSIKFHCHVFRVLLAPVILGRLKNRNEPCFFVVFFCFWLYWDAGISREGAADQGR